MPSLRRTLSSPSVRLSPYSNPSSSSTINQANRQQGGGHGPRRSLGSETGGRRVLADIDWWTVHAGQMFTPGHVSPSQVQDTEDDDQAEQEPPVNTITLAAAVPEDEFIAPNTLWHTALPGSGIGAFTELAQVPYAFGVNFDEPALSPLAHFSALSIAARTPSVRRSTVSSSSSAESSPTSTVSSLSPMADLGFSDIMSSSTSSYGFDAVPLSFPSPSRPSRQGTMATRSVSYSFYEATREREQRFDDMPCYPAESFSCTMSDADDLFFQ